MTSPCVTISKDAGLKECVDLMRQRQIRRAVVVDADGSVCGVIAQADLAEFAPEFALELLGEVSLPKDTEPTGDDARAADESEAEAERPTIH
jgi:Mg/Co/Ni transporter MgtE